MRYFLTGALSGNEEQLKIYREYLKAALTYSIAFDKFIGTRDKIKCFILYNGTLVFDAIVLHYCRKKNIPFITYETFLGNNSLIYKKNNEVMDLNWGKEYMLFSEEKGFPEDAATKVESFFSGLKRGDRMYAVLNKEHSNEKLEGLDNYVCLFTNLNFDTAVLDKNAFFNSMEDWIYSVIEYWKSNNIRKTLIIRVHPGEMKLVTASSEFIGDRIKKAAGDFPGIIVFDSTDKVNSYELLKRMDYGLIYSSTIGLEIAWSGKTLRCCGITLVQKETIRYLS